VVDRLAEDLGTEFPGVEVSASATFATCVPSPRVARPANFAACCKIAPGVITFKYCEPNSWPARFTLIMQSWDTANKSGELNDYSVCTTWGVYKNHFYLINVFRRRLNYPDLKRAVAQQRLRYKPRYILIEDKASGTQLIQDLRSDGVIGVHGFEPLPGNDKIMRAGCTSRMFRSRQSIFPA
jgi:predicted phage terminase large subunit-like protein